MKELQNTGMSEAEIDEKIRQEFLSGEWYKDWEKEGEELGEVTLEEFLEMIQEEEQEQAVLLQKEAEFVDDHDTCLNSHLIDRYYKEQDELEAPPPSPEMCPICKEKITVNENIVTCETENCVNLNLTGK